MAEERMGSTKKKDKKADTRKAPGPSPTRKYFAELLGTFALVLFGCGSAVLAGGEIGYYGIAFAFGLTVLFMCYAIGPISGCHINPAITLAMLTAGKIKGKDAAFYMIFQFIGAIVASAVLWAIAAGQSGYSIDVNGLGQNGFADHSPGKYSLEAGFLAEVVMTFMFLMVIFGATSKEADPKFAGLAIGISLVVIHLFGIPVTGVSVNPARSLGPALFVGGDALMQVWLFIFAPFIGGVLAAVMWKYALGPDEERSES